MSIDTAKVLLDQRGKDIVRLKAERDALLKAAKDMLDAFVDRTFDRPSEAQPARRSATINMRQAIKQAKEDQ